MAAASPESGASDVARSTRFRQRRTARDRLARRLIGLGGLVVIAAIVMIFFYLAYIVAPLFQPARAEMETVGRLAGLSHGRTLYLDVEEQREIGLRVTVAGGAEFFQVDGGTSVRALELASADSGDLSVVEPAIEQNGLVATAAVDGGVRVFRHTYETRFDDGVASRRIVPSLEFPYGGDALLQLGDSPATALALSESERGMVLAALDQGGHLHVLVAERIENLMTGAATLDGVPQVVGPLPGARAIAVSGDHARLYVGYADGRLQSWRLPGLEVEEQVQWQASPVTAMTMLLGGVSVLVGDATGRITQLFPVPDADSGEVLRAIRSFRAGTAPVEQIVVEPRRKGFAALDADRRLTLYHATSGRTVLQKSLHGIEPRAIALSPRADLLLIEGSSGALHAVDINNPHPEVSFSSLWQEVWYENYDEPAHVWQSSAATRDFEPKFSLTPLVFGTVKAALYAMLFAMPLALMGAAYTACFMAPRLRRLVKPGIEIMAALPTVILGFLAGLWFAPIIERHLAGLFAMLVIVPAGMLLFAWLWHRHGGRLRDYVREGFEPLVQLPVLALCVLVAFAIAEPLQYLLFGQDLRSWLTQVAGIDYDQRNALVVGCAMGFAVIPTIFTIAEDAMSGVPGSLSNGSLALGATPWQTLLFVVLPTASPGIFSALMIGFGRAVGETMIVLMATGNTPIMDWNVFEGMRTLAANIAIEMPESEVASTHYRILFLAALVLFVFTFLVNTIADLVRQRLRRRYGLL